LKISLLPSEEYENNDAMVEDDFKSSKSIDKEDNRLKEEEEFDKMLPNGNVTYLVEKKRSSIDNKVLPINLGWKWMTTNRGKLKNVLIRNQS
jgi:hypothetical protein